MEAAEARLLARAGRVRDSAGLTVAQRRANLAGTFAVRGAAPPGALLVVVDDVVTSGTTLTAAAGVLAATRPDGDTPVLGAVVAATPRPVLPRVPAAPPAIPSRGARTGPRRPG
ncbi:hypothetical protein ACWKWC_21515 [Geodermatophilus nigrescens]